MDKSVHMYLAEDWQLSKLKLSEANKYQSGIFGTSNLSQLLELN